VAEGCLSENAVVELLEGTLAEVELPAAQAHLDGCRSCRRSIELARASAGSYRPEAEKYDRSFRARCDQALRFIRERAGG
jgi:hypothetical protein